MTTNTRQRFVDTSLDLFYQNGFHAVGIDRIIQEVGTTKTTFYNHFASKDELIVAVVEKHDRWWQQTFHEELSARGGECPTAQLRAVFDVLRDLFSRYEFKGCLFINCANAFPQPHEPAHRAAKSNIDAIRHALADLAERAGIEDPHGFAHKYNLIIEGAVTTEAFDRDLTAADTAAELAEMLLLASLPAKT